jgi:hypothetical protein
MIEAMAEAPELSEPSIQHMLLLWNALRMYAYARSNGASRQELELCLNIDFLIQLTERTEESLGVQTSAPEITDNVEVAVLTYENVAKLKLLAILNECAINGTTITLVATITGTNGLHRLINPKAHLLSGLLQHSHVHILEYATALSPATHTLNPPLSVQIT